MPIQDSLDAALGGGIELAVRMKHRARLARLGHSQVLDTRRSGLWATAEGEPRGDCKLEVLIDGADAFPRIAEAIAGAESHVHITGWHLTPSFELVRGPHPTVLGELLAEAAERVPVRVLVWAGSPVPVFHPTRAEVTQTLETLTRRTRIRAEADPREHPVHCHHEKAIVIDGRLAFVGGIDMTDLAGDRYDLNSHPARRRLGWHDVGTCLQGPAVADVASHFAMRWRELTGDQHHGRPGTPTDQAPIESFFSHLKDEWPLLTALTDPAVLDAELNRIRGEYNKVRLHAAIGYVTPDDEHHGRGPQIRRARATGMRQARSEPIKQNRASKQ